MLIFFFCYATSACFGSAKRLFWSFQVGVPTHFFFTSLSCCCCCCCCYCCCCCCYCCCCCEFCSLWSDVCEPSFIPPPPIVALAVAVARLLASLPPPWEGCSLSLHSFPWGEREAVEWNGKSALMAFVAHGNNSKFNKEWLKQSWSWYRSIIWSLDFNNVGEIDNWAKCPP